jgi:hypothetical protein
VSFRYTETGVAKEGPWSALAGRTGYIQADAADVFGALYDGRQAQGTEVARWADAGRRFWKLRDSDPWAMRAPASHLPPR